MATEPVPTAEASGDAPVHKTYSALYPKSGRRVAYGVLRRLGLGIGLACVLGAASRGMWPYHDEIPIWVAAGSFLVGVSLPRLRHKQE